MPRAAHARARARSPTRVSITGAASTTMLRAQKPGANLAISGSIRGIIGNIQHSWSRFIKTGGERARALKAPLSLAALRLNMLSLLVRDAFQSGDSPALGAGATATGAGASSSALPAIGSSGTSSSSSRPRLIGGDDDFGAPLPVGTARLFSAQQLGRLQEISSSVRCECPNHLAQLVSSLAAFEEYSKKCESRDAGDAAIHAKLYRETSRARRLMEEALIALCRYERIDL